MKVGDLVKCNGELYLGIGLIVEMRGRNCRIRWLNPKYGCSWSGPGILELVA
jgi:alpha-mannosidase